MLIATKVLMKNRNDHNSDKSIRKIDQHDRNRKVSHSESLPEVF